MPEKLKYTVLKAGAYAGGERQPEDTVWLTEQEAKADVEAGNLEPAGEGPAPETESATEMRSPRRSRDFGGRDSG